MEHPRFEPRLDLLDRISGALRELDALHSELGVARQRLQRLCADLGGARVLEAVRETGPERLPDRAAERVPERVPEKLPATLTARELEVLGLLAVGCTNSAIATRLMIAEGTAKKHVFRVLRKLGVTNRSEAVVRWYRAGEGAGTAATR
jgi:DNA-binding NarL/FixJ family response regulator